MYAASAPTANKPVVPIAAGGLALIAIAIVLLTVGGLVTLPNPTVFDLWVLAIGVFVLAGALIVVGRRESAPVHTAPGVSVAYPFAPPPATGPGAPTWQEPAAIGHNAWGPPMSDTIAGQYFEVARASPSHAAARRPPQRPEEEGNFPTGLPFSAAVRRSALDSPPTGPAASPPPSEEAFADQIAQLNERVAELERSGRPASEGPKPPEIVGPAPSFCAGCGRTIVPGSPALVCPSCGRSLCSACFDRVSEGPAAHQCPACAAQIDMDGRVWPATVGHAP